MSGNDLVRVWKDPDERGDSAHPAGEISLDQLSGGFPGLTFPMSLCDQALSWLLACDGRTEPL